MTFHYTDVSGDHLLIQPGTDVEGLPIVAVIASQHSAVACVHVPLDRVEEFIAGLRDTARQAGSTT